MIDASFEIDLIWYKFKKKTFASKKSLSFFLKNGILVIFDHQTFQIKGEVLADGSSYKETAAVGLLTGSECLGHSKILSSIN